MMKTHHNDESFLTYFERGILFDYPYRNAILRKNEGGCETACPASRLRGYLKGEFE